MVRPQSPAKAGGQPAQGAKSGESAGANGKGAGATGKEAATSGGSWFQRMSRKVSSAVKRMKPDLLNRTKSPSGQGDASQATAAPGVAGPQQPKNWMDSILGSAGATAKSMKQGGAESKSPGSGEHAANGAESMQCVETPDLPPSQESVDTAAALFKAVDGMGTDEDMIFEALRGKSAAEIAAIKANFKKSYNIDLDERLASELSGDDMREAQALMAGDKVGATVAGLEGATGLLNDDEGRIEALMRDLDASEIQALKGHPETLDKVRGHLGGTDAAVFEALLAGDQSKATALRVDEAMDRWGTDEAALQRYFEQADDSERDAINLAYMKLHNTNDTQALQRELKSELSGGTEELALAALEKGATGADATRLHQAGSKMNVDEKAIWGVFEGKDAAEKAAIEGYFEDKYGKKPADKSDTSCKSALDIMLEKELDGDDLKLAKSLKTSGKIDRLSAVKIAIDGAGTDEALLKKAMANMTADEAVALQKDFAAAGMGDLNERLRGELSGIDLFESKQAMKGEPQSLEEAAQRAVEYKEFQRNGGVINHISSRIMDAGEAIGLHGTGSQLEDKTERIQALIGSDGMVIPGKEGEMQALIMYQKHDSEQYESAKESAGEGLATAAELAAAAALSVGTVGMASPALAALVVAGGSSAAGMATRKMVKGNSYGLQEGGTDAAKATASTLLSAGMASKGMGKIMSKGAGKLTKAAHLSSGYKPAIAGMLGDVTSGALQSGSQAAFDDDAWRYGGAGGGLLNMGVEGLKGGGDALKTAPAENLTHGAMAKPGRKTMGSTIMGQVAEKEAGYLSETLLSKDTWGKGGPDVAGMGLGALKVGGEATLDAAADKKGTDVGANKKLHKTLEINKKKKKKKSPHFTYGGS